MVFWKRLIKEICKIMMGHQYHKNTFWRICRPKNVKMCGKCAINVLTEAVCKIETVQKWHLSNLSNILKFFFTILTGVVCKAGTVE